MLAYIFKVLFILFYFFEHYYKIKTPDNFPYNPWD